MGKVYLVEEPPEVEFRGGMFYVTERSTGMCFCGRPNTFFRTIAAMVGCSRQHRLNSAEIVAMPDLAERIAGERH